MRTTATLGYAATPSGWKESCHERSLAWATLSLLRTRRGQTEDAARPGTPR